MSSTPVHETQLTPTRSTSTEAGVSHRRPPGSLSDLHVTGRRCGRSRPRSCQGSARSAGQPPTTRPWWQPMAATRRRSPCSRPPHHASRSRLSRRDSPPWLARWAARFDRRLCVGRCVDGRRLRTSGSPVIVGEFAFYVPYVGAGAGRAQPASALFVLGCGPGEGFGWWCGGAGAAAAGAVCGGWVGVVDHGPAAYVSGGFRPRWTVEAPRTNTSSRAPT